MEPPLLAGLLASCSAIGALAGIRHQHLSTLIREQTRKLQELKSEDHNFAAKVCYIQLQIDTFCKRNVRLKYSVASCIVAITALVFLFFPPICNLTWSSEFPSYVAALGLFAALLIVSLEFFESQLTLDFELLLTKIYVPSARFMSREKKLKDLESKYFPK